MQSAMNRHIGGAAAAQPLADTAVFGHREKKKGVLVKLWGATGPSL